MADFSAGDVLKTSSLGMLSVVIFCLAGFLIAHYPGPDKDGGERGVLTQQGTRKLSQMCYFLFIPTLLITTLGGGLNSELLGSSWQLIAWAPLHCAVGLGIGWLLTRVVAVPAHMRHEFLCSCGFGNAVSLPLLLLETLVPQLSIFEGKEDEALARGVMYVFIHSLGWQLLWWGGAYNILASSANEAHGKALLVDDEAAAVEEKVDADAVAEGGVAERDVGVSFSSGAKAAPRAEAAAVLAAHAGQRKREGCMHAVLRTLTTVFGSPPILSLIAGCLIGLVPSLRDFMTSILFPIWDVSKIIGTAAVPLMNLVLAGSLYQGMMAIVHARNAAKRLEEEDESDGNDEEDAVKAAAGAEAADSSRRGDGEGAADVGAADDGEAKHDEAHVAAAASAKDATSPDSFVATRRRTQSLPAELVAHRRLRAVSSSDAHSSTDPLHQDHLLSFPTRESTGGVSVHELVDKPPLLSVPTLIALIFGRLILSPAILFPVFLLLREAEVPVWGLSHDADPLVVIVLCVQFGMPPPTMLLLVTSKLGKFKAASELALLYVVTYFVSIFTLVGVTAAALSVAFPTAG